MNGPSTHVVLRADAGPTMGAGHLVRSLALGQRLKANGARVVVATRTVSPPLLEQIRDSSLELAIVDGRTSADDAAQTSALTLGTTSRWVVVDGYQFGADYLDALRQTGCQVAIVDDRPRMDSYPVDLLIDPNPGALRQPYSTKARTLLGTRFVAMRSEMMEAPRRARSNRSSSRARVLVTMGSADVGAVLPVILGALRTMPNLETMCVLGALNPRASQVLQDFGSVPGFSFVPHATDLPALMASVDVAIASVGITLWELAFVGVPTLVTSSTDAQDAIAAVVDEYGAHQWMGNVATLSVESVRSEIAQLLGNEHQRDEMTRLGHVLVDGLGAERIARSIVGEPGTWRVRRADLADVEPIWEIASDPSVRGMAFGTSAFDFPQHERWFSARITSGKSLFWVADRDGTIGGFVRYDRVDDRADIDVAVAPSARGRGLGSMLLARTAIEACDALEVQRTQGLVLDDNIASQRAFAKAGFRCLGADVIHDRQCVIFERAVPARV